VYRGLFTPTFRRYQVIIIIIIIYYATEAAQTQYKIDTQYTIDKNNRTKA